MRRIETYLPGVCILEPDVYGDTRGFFFESYNQKTFAGLGISDVFVQDNHSRSARGVLRGLHYQLRQPQAKLCRVILGEVQDVAVDIRRGSPTFGQWVSVHLSAKNRRMIYIPAGYAHGYLALSEAVEFLYKCDAFYASEDEHGLLWNDPKLGIAWELNTEPLLSRKDAQNPTLAHAGSASLPLYRTDADLK